jgi:hypothetical protein
MQSKVDRQAGRCQIFSAAKRCNLIPFAKTEPGEPGIGEKIKK